MSENTEFSFKVPQLVPLARSSKSPKRNLKPLLEKVEKFYEGVNLDDLVQRQHVGEQYLLRFEDLNDMRTETSKLLKESGEITNFVGDLKTLIGFLRINLKSSFNLSLITFSGGETFQKVKLERYLKPVLRNLCSAHIILTILTENNMPKEIYLEDVIDEVFFCIKHHLSNSIHLFYDKKKHPNNNFYFPERVCKALNDVTIEILSLIKMVNELLDIVPIRADILEVLSLMAMETIFIQHLHENLKVICVELLTKVFLKSPDKQRRSLLDSLRHFINNIQQWDLGNYCGVEIVTYVIIYLFQSLVSIPIAVGHRKIVAICNRFWEFFEKLIENSTTESRVLIRKIIDDFVKHLNNPEWPLVGHLIIVCAKVLRYFAAFCEQSDNDLKSTCFGGLTQITRAISVELSQDLTGIEEICKNFQTQALSNENDKELLLKKLILKYVDAKCDNSGFCKEFYLAEIDDLDKIEIKNGDITEQDQILIFRYFFRKNQSENLENVKTFLKVAGDESASPVLRTKCLRNFASVVSSDPNVVNVPNFESIVKNCLQDVSISVRESALEILESFATRNTELFENNYFEILTEQLQDSGISVRKRAILLSIQLIRNANLKLKHYLCCLVLHNIKNDSLHKMIKEFFRNYWFDNIDKSIVNMIQVCGKSRDNGKCFEQLIESLSKEGLMKKKLRKLGDKLVANLNEQWNDIGRMTITEMLLALAKTRPKCIVKHLDNLAPKLNICPTDKYGEKITLNILKIAEILLELCQQKYPRLVTLYENQCNKSLQKSHYYSIVKAAMECLKVTAKLRNNGEMFAANLKEFHVLLSDAFENKQQTVVGEMANKIERAIATSGLLFMHFDLTTLRAQKEDMELFLDLYVFFLQTYPNLKSVCLKSIGNLCLKNFDFFLNSNVREVLTALIKNGSDENKIEILDIFEQFLILLEQNENKENDNENAEKGNRIQDMDDINMATITIQEYLSDISNCYLNPDKTVRMKVATVIKAIHEHGCTPSNNLIPWLIGMYTDSEVQIEAIANTCLNKINERFPNIIVTRTLAGIDVAFILQTLIQDGDITRGCSNDSAETRAKLEILYTLLSKQKLHCRRLLLNILGKIQSNVKEKWQFLFDNLALFPYKSEDEVLFLIYHIDLVIATEGFNFLNDVRGNMYADNRVPQIEDEINVEFLKLIPENVKINSGLHYTVLLKLKKYLQATYKVTDERIFLYSPHEPRAIEKKYTKKRTKEVPLIGRLKVDNKREFIDWYLDMKDTLLEHVLEKNGAKKRNKKFQKVTKKTSKLSLKRRRLDSDSDSE